MPFGIICASEPPFIPTREGVDIVLDTLALVSEDCMRKLVMKSKTTSCDLDQPSWLKGTVMSSIAHLPLGNFHWGISTRVEDCTCCTTAEKKTGLDPIHKSDRPVSTIQFVSKLTERAVISQLCHHSECGFSLPPCQSDYRTGHSTETALVQSDILLHMDQQKVTQF